MAARWQGGRTRSALSEREYSPQWGHDPTAASIYDKYSAGPSFSPIGTGCCFTMIKTIQACSNFNPARVFIINTRPDEILSKSSWSLVWSHEGGRGIALSPTIYHLPRGERIHKVPTGREDVFMHNWVILGTGKRFV